MFYHRTLQQALNTILDLKRVLEAELRADREAGILDEENNNFFLLKNTEETIKVISYDLANTISLVWSVEDVKECRPDLTDDQCREVLEVIEDNQDAGEGVTWDTIEGECEVLYPQKPTKLYLTEGG